MKRINATIIEDEPTGTKALYSLLNEYHPEVQINRYARTVDEARNAFADPSTQLFFADIELLDGNVFDALEEVTLRTGQHIVFITAYPQFGVKAYDYSAIHYLMKPISPVGLQKALLRYQSFMQASNPPSSDAISKFHENRLLIPTQNGTQFIDLNAIVRVQSANKYTIVYTTDKRQHIVSKPLSRFEELIGEKGFARVHDSHIVNIFHISSYSRGKGGEVTMVDGSRVPVSSRRKDALSVVLNLAI